MSTELGVGLEPPLPLPGLDPSIPFVVRPPCRCGRGGVKPSAKKLPLVSLTKITLRDFLNYNNLTSNYYQVKKLKTFFDLVKKNFIIESFSHKHYRMLVTVPEVFVYKSEQNILMVEILIAEELFDYLHPFLFNDFFQQKLNKHQFQVLFEIIKNYSSIHLRKDKSKNILFIL